MKNLIDADVLVYRTGFGYAGFDFYDNIEGMDKVVKKIKDKFPDYNNVLILSNTNKTFRHDVAVTLPYKGNRKADKPPFYLELRQYLLEELGATLSRDGFEADDEIGVTLDKKTDILTTIDKDLNMIPAKGHYNFVKDEMVKIKRPAYYFWKQMLTGDKADNIKGLTGIGEAISTRMLADEKTTQMRGVVEEAYKIEFGEKWFDRFDENGKLLWIKRHPDREYFSYL